MSEESNKKRDKLKSYVQTVVFILVVSAVFTALLAAANAAAQPKIRENTLLEERRALLSVFALDTTGSSSEIFSRFDENIQPAQSAGLDLYVQVDKQGQLQGYAIPFGGPGLWGMIEGYLGVSADRQTILGLVFTAQNETPGLGGRIEEPWFRDQFRGLKIQPGTELKFGVTDDGQQLDAITGATSTSKAVLKILNPLFDQTISQLEEVVPGE
jgi:Na+-transporting NADH:ubiquinone oxidoreductase subunit C